jgi:hypothetical protein
MKRVTVTIDNQTRAQLLRVLDELDARHGKPTAAERAKIDREMRQIFGSSKSA